MILFIFVPLFVFSIVFGKRGQGIGNREQGTVNREQKTTLVTRLCLAMHIKRLRLRYNIKAEPLDMGSQSETGNQLFTVN